MAMIIVHILIYEPLCSMYIDRATDVSMKLVCQLVVKNRNNFSMFFPRFGKWKSGQNVRPLSMTPPGENELHETLSSCHENRQNI